MIIVDTSVWVEHIRGKNTPLDKMLGLIPVLLHPFVHGELLLHGLARASAVNTALEQLEQAPLASAEEVAAFISWAKLQSTGVGYVDAHLLVSARALLNGKIVTFDKHLHVQAERLGIAYAP